MARWTRDKPFAFLQVVSHIRVAPPGIYLSATGESLSRDFLLRSADRPFRVLDVSGPLVVRRDDLISPESKRVHRVQPALDPHLADSAEVSKIEISTDHPNQPLVTVDVLMQTAGH